MHIWQYEISCCLVTNFTLVPVGAFLRKLEETIEEFINNHLEFYINREDPQTPCNRVDNGLERAPLTSLNNGSGNENFAKLDLESQYLSTSPPEILSVPKIYNILGFNLMKKHKLKPQHRRISVSGGVHLPATRIAVTVRNQSTSSSSPTRRINATSIDAVCTNLRSDETDVQIINTGISDHTAQLCRLTQPVSCTNSICTTIIYSN
ncbi:hypothetical protein J6590_060640 [Homalodisca vitripennis]|nr:hypothetical protein J6590_060640 [Homalodisca vitripennis]